MDLTPDNEQQSLVTATADWCRDNMPLEQARNRDSELWQELETMGWLAMTSPDMGLDHATEALVFAELGRHLAPVAMLSSGVASRWADHSGHTALALMDGKAARVFDLGKAKYALAASSDAVGIASLPSGIEAAPSLDQSASLVRLDPAPAFTALRDPRSALHMQLLAAAFAVGCSDAARDMAAEYAKLREQFERPIGWFQSLKHICSDMAVRCEVARSQLYFAACALDAADNEAEFHVASAKHLADNAALENGRANIQVHGGIGMTDEAYPHFCLKRAHLLAFISPAKREILLGKAV